MLELILLFGYLPLMFLLVVQVLQYRKLKSLYQQSQKMSLVWQSEYRTLRLENLRLLYYQKLGQSQSLQQSQSPTERSEFQDWDLQQG